MGPKRTAASPTVATCKARRGSKRVVEPDADDEGDDQETQPPLPAKDSAAKKKRRQMLLLRKQRKDQLRYQMQLQEQC